MAGRQDGLLCPVEQEYEVICEGDSLAGQHHPHHLQHHSTAGTIVTGTGTLKLELEREAEWLVNLWHAVKMAVEKEGRPRARWAGLRRNPSNNVFQICVNLDNSS